MIFTIWAKRLAKEKENKKQALSPYLELYQSTKPIMDIE